MSVGTKGQFIGIDRDAVIIDATRRRVTARGAGHIRLSSSTIVSPARLQHYGKPSTSESTNCCGCDQKGECPESSSKNSSQRFGATTRLHSGRMVQSRVQ